MTISRLFAATLVVSLCPGAARAFDPERTSGIDREAGLQLAKGAWNGRLKRGAAAGEKAAKVDLPQLSVTSATPELRFLPSLKPLPKWDPRICIGC